MARRLTDWIKTYLEYTKHSEAPEDFHFWTAVSTIAGALRRKVWLDMLYFEWTPNFFIVFVAPPGVVAKSTTAGIGMDLLHEVEGIHFGPSSGTWQGLIDKMSQITEEYPLPDGTYLKQSAITIAASELGTFYDPRNQDLTNVIVDLWDGKRGAWDKLTKHDGEERVYNPWINLIGCTTPAWIAENFTQYFIGGGMASRTVFVFCDKKRKLVAYPKRAVNINDFKHLAEDLTHDLQEIAYLSGEFELTEEAYQWGESWYEEHNTTVHKHLLGDKFGGYIARKQTHAHKLAMILSAARRDTLIIERADLEEAMIRLRSIEDSMPRILGSMNREQEMELAAEILNFIRVHEGMFETQVYREHMHLINIETFKRIKESLRASGYLKSEQRMNEAGETDFFLKPIYPKGNKNGTDA